MLIDIGERMPGKQDGPGPIIYGPPRAPRIAKNAHFCLTPEGRRDIGGGLSVRPSCVCRPPGKSFWLKFLMYV